ncbi:MAG: TetR family transcriptional regulator [Oleiphilaceae bacterium]|nr:TetR family transcriptional regulator [Oleiphilaceae bacterium]
MRRTKEEAEQTRLHIIKAALTLFSRDGYSHTTLAMIAKEAGYSRGPIYWHFRNKDHLYQAVLAYSQSPLENLVINASAETDNPLKTIETFACDWLDLLVNDAWFRQSFEILLNKTELTSEMADTLKRERELTRRIIDTLTHLIQAAQAQALIPSAQAPGQLALVTYTYLMGITQSWLFAPRLFSLKKERGFFVARLRGLLEQA